MRVDRNRGLLTLALTCAVASALHGQTPSLLVGRIGTLNSLEADVLRWAARSTVGRLSLWQAASTAADNRGPGALDTVGRAAGFTSRSSERVVCTPRCPPEIFADLTSKDLHVLVGPLLAPNDSTRVGSYEMVTRLRSGSLSSRALSVIYVARNGAWVLKDFYLTSH